MKLENNEDQDKVMDGGPCIVEGEAVLLQRWEVGMTDEDFINTKINIWIRIHGLPYELKVGICRWLCTICRGGKKRSS